MVQSACRPINQIENEHFLEALANVYDILKEECATYHPQFLVHFYASQNASDAKLKQTNKKP